MKCVLKNNIFQFNGKIYRQICGIVMGTKLALALVLVVVAHHDKEYPDVLHQPLVWKRYIAMYWLFGHIPGTTLTGFLFGLNNCVHSKLRFNMDISFISIQFLDITIYKGPTFYQTGQLSASIYFKQTNTFSYLQCIRQFIHIEIHFRRNCPGQDYPHTL